MKKFLSFLFVIACSFCASVGTTFLRAYATGDTKEYLIGYDYETSAGVHGIGEQEICDASPFDVTTVARMPGKSIKIAANQENKFAFDKTYETISVAATSGQSIFMYIMFNETTSHTLVISASDGFGASQSWTLSKQLIESNIKDQVAGSHRYGWMLVELPLEQALTINSLEYSYSSETPSEIDTFARVIVYAPYVATSVATDVAITGKQNFYNYSAPKFGSYKYVEDKFRVTSLGYLFDYFYIGEIDYLNNMIEEYKIILKIDNIDNSDPQVHTFNGTSDVFEYIFSEAANYQISFILTQDNVQLLGKVEYYLIHEFDGVFVTYGMPAMHKGKKYVIDISTSSDLINSSNLAATSSSEKIAKAYIQDGKLVIETYKSGKVDITLSVLGEREGMEAKTYSKTYIVKVAGENKGVNWWLMGGTAIFLIIASIVVYTIMVKRRLIKGKYPKY